MTQGFAVQPSSIQTKLERRRNHQNEFHMSSSETVNRLMGEIINSKDAEADETTSRSKISKLLEELPLPSDKNDRSSFDDLIGYYNVSYTLTSKPKENPVGGKWTRSQRLWKIQRTLQHVLPAKETAKPTGGAPVVVAQVINAIFLECLWGLLPIWIVLRGDAVPLNKIPKQEVSTDDKPKQKPAPATLLPGLSPRTVRAYFDAPRFALGKFVFTFGPTSSVVLDTPYVDDKIRIGVGGTSGTKFVFSRIEDTQGVNDWKWVLEKPSVITKTKASYGLLWTSLLSGFAYKNLRFGMGKVVSGGFFLTSLVLLGLVMVSTGGIETNSDNYTPGVEKNTESHSTSTPEAAST